MVANLTALLLSAITIYLFILVIGPLIITFHWDWIMATKAFYWYVKFPFFLSSLISSLPLFAYGIFALYPRRISGVSARSRRIALNPANHLFRMLGWHDSKRGRLLQLKQRGTWVIFRFTTALECWYWAAHMANLITEHPTSPEESVGETEPGQIVLLRKRLNIRYQLLGTLEAKAEKRWVAEAGLQVRAAMIKADAVVDVQEERLTDFHRTVRRLTGTAVRAVDPEGRFEFRSRWFANRIAQVCSWTVSLLLVYLLFSFIEQFTR
jgi:hypothetical protein